MLPKDRENKRYREGFVNPIDQEEQFMFSQLPAGGGKLLDVGSGDGTVALELERRGFDVKCLDFSSVAVMKAREKGIDVITCDLDEKGIPYEEKSFDIVWAGDIIEHVFDPIFLLEEIARVAKHDGTILISVPNDMHINNRIMFALWGTSPQSGVYRSFRQCKHHTIFSIELLDYMLKEAGLSWDLVAAISRWPWPFYYRKFITSNKRIAGWFGCTLVVKAKPKQEL